MESQQKFNRLNRMATLVDKDTELQTRLSSVLGMSRRVRASEYHLTNACNIRCKGCWFFEHGHDESTPENRDLRRLRQFLGRERAERKINTALVIGGEPTLFLDRLKVFVDEMRYVTISTNGIRRLPYEGFENVGIGITLFGGGPLDDELRGIRPNGRAFTGLFDRALEHYRNDPRVGFIFALSEDGIEHIEPTVRSIAQNGNRVTFNFYSRYASVDPLAMSRQEETLNEALRVQASYPETVMSHPYYIRALITGESHWGAFGYDECPSLSVDYAGHAERFANGRPHLPFFNTYAADLKTVKFCCTSGHCSGCRDSQAMQSWILVNLDRFLASKEQLETWVEIAESYWSQFVWSSLHPANLRQATQSRAVA